MVTLTVNSSSSPSRRKRGGLGCTIRSLAVIARPNTEVLQGDLRRVLRALKQVPGQDLHVIGSVALVRSLLRHHVSLVMEKAARQEQWTALDRAAAHQALEHRPRRLAIVLVHEVHERSRHELGRRMAQRAVPRFVDAREIAVEAGDAQQIAGHREEALELLLRARPPDEFSELTAERREHAQDLFVRLEDRSGEELEDADDLVAEQHRQAERRMQPRGERRVAS